MEEKESVENKTLEWITDKIRTVIKVKFPNMPDTAINNLVEDQVKLLEKSDSIVYCSDCGLTFYLGYKNSNKIVFDKRFLDFEMLAFRHSWDTRHTVKISLAFFKQKLPGVGFFSLNRFLPVFDKDNEINYSKIVEDKREWLESVGSERARHSHDENWDAGSRCYCSVCGKSFADPKQACMCCFGQKPWMPYNEVEKINVKPNA